MDLTLAHISHIKICESIRSSRGTEEDELRKRWPRQANPPPTSTRSLGPMTKRGMISFSSRALKPPKETQTIWIVDLRDMGSTTHQCVCIFVGIWRSLFCPSNRVIFSGEVPIPTPIRHANRLRDELKLQQRKAEEKSSCTADVTNLPLLWLDG